MPDYASWSLWLKVWDWPIQAQVLVGLAVLVGLWALGQRRMAHAPGAEAPGLVVGRRLSFMAGTVVVLFAIQSPIDTLADYSFAWHMLQHTLLMLVVAPLWVAGGIAPALGEALARLGAYQAWQRWRWAAGLRRRISQPDIAIGGFTAALWAGHLPVVWNYAQTHVYFHEAEHLAFLGVSLIYWSLVMGATQRGAEAGYARRIAYLGAGILSCWVLGIALMFARGPLYRSYLLMPGVTVRGLLSDQVLGSAIMWAPSMVPFDIVLSVYIQRFLKGHAPADGAPGAIAPGLRAP